MKRQKLDDTDFEIDKEVYYNHTRMGFNNSLLQQAAIMNKGKSFHYHSLIFRQSQDKCDFT